MVQLLILLMINYFIPELSAAQAEKLKGASISFYDFTLGDERGVMIEESRLLATLEVLQANIAKQDPTTYDGIVRVKIEAYLEVATQPDAGIRSGTWKGKNKDGMAQIAAQILKPRLQKGIMIHNPQAVVAPIEDGLFHVHIYSSPKSCKSGEGVTVPSMVWGIPSTSSKNAWPRSGTGRAITDESGKYAIAELVGENNLYILQDLAANAGADDLALFSHVLMRAIYLLEPRQPQDALRALFIEECRKCFSYAVLAQDNLSADAETENPRAVAKALAALIRTTRLEEQRLLKHESLSLDRFGVEYDNLLRVPKVTDVKVEGGEIRVFTKTLYCKDGHGQWREIGAFQIALNPKEKSPRWHNLTRQVNAFKPGMQAPHVWPAGNACLGNTVTTFETLFNAQQWAIAAALAIEFVESVNLGDPAGKYIGSWPLGTPPADPEAKPEVAVDNEAHQAHRRKYMLACSSRMDELVVLMRNGLIEKRKEIERLEAKLIQLLRAKLIATRQTKGLTFCDSAQFAREFDALQSMPKVQEIRVEPRSLSIVTDTLVAVHPNTSDRHSIGRFKITIQMDGHGDSIRWVCLDATTHGCVKNQQAPQVLNSGRAFLSEIKESFAELIASAQFSTVAQLAIEFIEQVNVDEPGGAQISNWPRATN